MPLPYETASSGQNALGDLQKVLERFGCTSFGTMQDFQNGVTRVQFQWRGKVVDLQASWRGYAAAWLKQYPYSTRKHVSKAEWEEKALKRGQVAVCSILRDWVKAQVTAVESGLMTFDAVFMPHMLLSDGTRVIDKVEKSLLGLEHKK